MQEMVNRKLGKYLGNFGNHNFVFYVCESVCLVNKSFVYFRFHK